MILQRLATAGTHTTQLSTPLDKMIQAFDRKNRRENAASPPTNILYIVGNLKSVSVVAAEYTN